MKALWWLLRLVLFFLVLSFSLRNTQAIVLEVVPGYVMQSPLIIVLLLTFVAGVAVTWLAMLPSIIRARRLSAGSDAQTNTDNKNNTNDNGI
ncbi:MAG: LapA family protein [Burkholderiales bacterium]|nr:LapA family protein [Burkholderiales bacterium]